MNEYEVLIETTGHMGPGDGEAHARKELIEVEAESPEAYVKQHGEFPIMDTVNRSNGDTVIITGDCKGNFIRYTFFQ